MKVSSSSEPLDGESVALINVGGVVSGIGVGVVVGVGLGPGVGVTVGKMKILGVAVGATVSGALIVTGAGLCAGVVTCTIGAAFIIAGFATAGYMTGSTYNPDLDSRVLLWPYENNALDRLQCSVLQGQDFLELRKTVN